MKRLFMVVLMLVLAMSIFTNPAIPANGNAESRIGRGLLQVDMDTVFEALQPYLDAWGPYDGIATHLCVSCEGSVAVVWADSGTVLHYVEMIRSNGEWVITDASELPGVIKLDPANTS